MSQGKNTTAIAVTDEEFANGYQTGYLQQKTTNQTKPVAEMDIYALYDGTITSVRHCGRYHAGYIMGWTAALLGATPPDLVAAPQREEVKV